jgi:hypothetical protein
LIVKIGNLTKIDPVLDARSTYISNQPPPTHNNNNNNNNSNKNTHNDQTSFFSFSNGFPTIHSADTLHVVGSDPNRIQPHAKYQRKRSAGCCRFRHLVRPQLPGSAQNDERRFLFFRTASRAFAALMLCMWSDTIMI